MQRRTLRAILTTSLAVLIALATGGAVMAFSSGPPVEVQAVPPVSVTQPGSGASAATNCRVSYTNGSGTNELSWCFSDDGNLVMLEHGDGVEHVRLGDFIEGWCVSAGGTKRGETDGENGNVTLKPPSYPSPDKVRHNTADGDLRVESRFSTSPGNKQIVVKMNVRNNTGAPLNNVFLTRFIDADISNTDFNDEWTSTVRSVTAHEPGSGMLQLFPKTSEFNANSMIFSGHDPVLDNDCYDAAADATLSAPAGDRSMGVLYQLGTIFPGQTKTVQFVYRISN